MKILIKELLSSSLSSVFAVEQLFEEINKSEDNNIILDYREVDFITLSFAQAYIASKKQSNKNIKEINLTKENQTTLNLINQE